MANPFATMAGVSPQTAGQPAPGGDSGAGITSAPASNVGPTAMPGAISNPFASSIMPSDAPGIFGLLGRLSGNPTSMELAARRMGSIQAEGYRGLAERFKRMPPQQAVIDWLTTDPHSMEAFMGSKDPVGDIKNMIGNLSPPSIYTSGPGGSINTQTGQYGAYAPINQAPGDKAIIPGTNYQAQNLPADVQSLQAFEEAAKYTPAQIENINRAMATAKSTTDISVKKAAYDGLVNAGIISQGMEDKLVSGVAQITPFFDITGKQLGMHFTDYTDAINSNDPTKVRSTVLGVNNNTNGVNNQVLAAANGPDGVDQYGVRNVGRPPADIVLAAGAFGKAVDAATPWTSLIDPNFANAKFYSDAHDKMENVVASLQQLVEQSGGKLAGPYNELKSMVDEHGWTGSSLQQVIAFRNLVQSAQREILQNNSELNDMSGYTPGDAKSRIAYENHLMRGILAKLPTEPDLIQMEARIEQGEGSLPDMARKASAGVGATVDRIKKNLGATVDNATSAVQSATGAPTAAPQSGGTNPPPSFQNPSDAEAAAKAGTLKPDAKGVYHYDLNGTPMTMTKKAKKQ